MKTLKHTSHTALFLACVASLASCQRQNEIELDNRQQITLTPEVATKGTSVTTANISEFAAFGYAQGHADWADVSTTATSNLMFNNKYTKLGNSWVGATKTPWPDNEFKRYSFFAYSPAASAANKITVLTNNSTPGYQRLSYETLSDVSKQVDLVLASRLNQTPAKEVPLSFGHALSRVGFCASADKSGVTVKSISINGVKYKGEIEVRSGADWSNVLANKANFTAAISSGELSTDSNNPTMLTGVDGTNYFMLLPQDLTGNTDNTTCITVVTTKGGRDRSQSYTITHNYQKGKSLLYKLSIPDGVDLVVDYTVTDWATNIIPTDIKATYLNVNSLSENAPVTFFYATDYAGAVTATEVGTTGKLAITQDAARKSFTVKGIVGGVYKVKVTAGNLSKIVDIMCPIAITPIWELNVPYVGASYTVNINSMYPWSVTTNYNDITITPSSGVAGTDTPVVINVDANTDRFQRSIIANFTCTNGTNTWSTTLSGYQAANPDYYVGRFAGAIVTKTIDANTTRYYFSKRLFAAAADESGTYNWSNSRTSTGVVSTTDGKSNTAALAGTNNPAANRCYTKSGGHWYLPASDQLAALWISRNSLPSVTWSIYWSSTENGDNAYYVNMATGQLLTIDKTTPRLVRCVWE